MRAALQGFLVDVLLRVNLHVCSWSVFEKKEPRLGRAGAGFVFTNSYPCSDVSERVQVR